LDPVFLLSFSALFGLFFERANSLRMGNGGATGSSVHSFGGGMTESLGQGLRTSIARPSFPLPSTASPWAIQTSPLRLPSTTVILAVMLRLEPERGMQLSGLGNPEAGES